MGYWFFVLLEPKRLQWFQLLQNLLFHLHNRFGNFQSYNYQRIHKDIAILTTLINGLLYFFITKSLTDQRILQSVNYILVFLVLQIITGVALSYFALPPWAQALHILLATLLFSAQFYFGILRNLEWRILMGIEIKESDQENG